jgi:hypothetical protein
MVNGFGSGLSQRSLNHLLLEIYGTIAFVVVVQFILREYTGSYTRQHAKISANVIDLCANRPSNLLSAFAEGLSVELLVESVHISAGNQQYSSSLFLLHFPSAMKQSKLALLDLEYKLYDLHYPLKAFSLLQKQLYRMDEDHKVDFHFRFFRLTEQKRRFVSCRPPATHSLFIPLHLEIRLSISSLAISTGKLIVFGT